MFPKRQMFLVILSFSENMKGAWGGGRKNSAVVMTRGLDARALVSRSNADCCEDIRTNVCTLVFALVKNEGKK